MTWKNNKTVDKVASWSLKTRMLKLAKGQIRHKSARMMDYTVGKLESLAFTLKDEGTQRTKLNHNNLMRIIIKKDPRLGD